MADDILFEPGNLMVIDVVSGAHVLGSMINNNSEFAAMAKPSQTK